MKFTVLAIAAGLAATPIAHYITDEATTVGDDSQIVLPASDEAPWYEQAETLEQDDSDIVMVRKEVVQAIPEESKDLPTVHATEAEIECLMSAAYHEARGEPREGRVAVVEVVLARRNSKRWPSNACSVIAQRSQFSFVRRGRIPDVPDSSEGTLRSLVMDVLTGRESSSAKGATFFHATYVRPTWRHRLRQVSQIGRHMFYAT